jgi:N-acetylneuraminate lyase
MIKKLNIKGLISAPFTPMHSNGAINLAEIEKYANQLKKDNVVGVFICGTTGEGMLMNVEERMAVALEWMKYKASNFKIIVHVGSTSFSISETLAVHAQEIGADAIGTMGPVFLPPNDAASLVDYCEPIAKAAPNLPFYYYHVPSISNVSVPMKEFLIEADKRIPNLVGIKFTHNNLMEMQQCLALNNEQFEILHGYDEVLLAGLSIGAIGAVGSTYNYMASCYSKIINAFNQGNLEEARKWQQYSVTVVEVLIKYGGGVRAGKEIMSLVGINSGPGRAPIKKFSSEEKINLKNALEAIDFFDNIKFMNTIETVK